MATVPSEKPHVLLFPFPAQGHINPFLKLSKLLHTYGLHITFVNTEYNHNRIIRTHGLSALTSLDDFRFETISDGLPLSDDVARDIATLCYSTSKRCHGHFRNLLLKLNGSPSGVPPVTCIISDGVLSFALDVAEEFGIPGILFWTTSASAFMGCLQYPRLIDRGLTPLKDISNLSDGYLDTKVDEIPGMYNMRLRDFASFIRTVNSNDPMLNFVLVEIERASKASTIILNTYDDLEHPVLEAMASIVPPIYTIGPLHLLSREMPNPRLDSISVTMWKEDHGGYLEWLEQRELGSVIYVNFGTITVMTNEQLIEFAWGLAKSNYHFLWIIRPDLVMDDNAVIPQEFLDETKGRGLLLAGWCKQEAVLSHPSIGGFLTHSGWNSTLESIGSGVPMVCWPFFADQPTNCKYTCTDWGIGMEIDNTVNREKVELMIRELMEGEKGKEMRKRALELKEKATRATKVGGSSFENLGRMVKEILLLKIDKKSS